MVVQKHRDTNHETRTCVVAVVVAAAVAVVVVNVVFDARLTSHTKRRKIKNLETVPNFALYLLQLRFTAALAV